MAIARSPITVLDCPDPAVLAAFYGALLDWPVSSHDAGTWFEITSSAGQRLAFQQVANYAAPQWPSQEHPQQMHLDVDVADLDEAEAATLTLGASKAEVQPGVTFRVFLDPAGHPFCLCLE